MCRHEECICWLVLKSVEIHLFVVLGLNGFSALALEPATNPVGWFTKRVFCKHIHDVLRAITTQEFSNGAIKSHRLSPNKCRETIRIGRKSYFAINLK